jgi:anthranilate 1,2-dioxygenase small subunit
VQRNEVREKAEDLLHAYVGAIDDDRLEDWPDFFTERCLYKVVTYENHALSMPLALMLCDSRGMLQDRVTAHREANLFAPHLYRHLVSAIRVVGERDGGFEIRANYAVFRTMIDPVEYGSTSLYSTGEYRDLVVFKNGEAKLREKIVIADTSRIGSLLVTPI